MEKILVLGCAGHCGLAVTKELINRGFGVIALYKSSKPKIDSVNIHYVQGDATRYEDLYEALQGATGVINCIGFGKGSGKPTDFFSLNNQLLLKAMKARKVQHLVTMSNVGVFTTGNRFVFKFIVPIFMQWLKHILDDKERMENDLRNEKEIQWVAARFPNIVAGPAQKVKMDADGKSLSLSITTGSVGQVLVNLLVDREQRLITPCYSN